jgi:hypothetical protein
MMQEIVCVHEVVVGANDVNKTAKDRDRLSRTRNGLSTSSERGGVFLVAFGPPVRVVGYAGV